jgi:hypothetical protein
MRDRLPTQVVLTASPFEHLIDRNEIDLALRKTDGTVAVHVRASSVAVTDVRLRSTHGSRINRKRGPKRDDQRQEPHCQSHPPHGHISEEGPSRQTHNPHLSTCVATGNRATKRRVRVTQQEALRGEPSLQKSEPCQGTRFSFSPPEFYGDDFVVGATARAKHSPSPRKCPTVRESASINVRRSLMPDALPVP